MHLLFCPVSLLNLQSQGTKEIKFNILDVQSDIFDAKSFSETYFAGMRTTWSRIKPRSML